MSDSSTDTLTAPADDLAVEVRVESPSACSRRLSITIPAAEVDRRFEEAFSAMQRDAVLPGFRRGKVPRALLEKRVGGDLAKDTRDRLLGEALGAAIRKESLRPLGD
ncbi:MAG: trigger factor family protein, partial [Phycisphaerales bacterium]